MAYGIVNSDLMTTSDGVSSAGLYGFKNRIINGDMRIDQRNAGASVTPTASGVYTYITDRWGIYVSQNSKLVSQQAAGVTLSGFYNALYIASSSAYTVLAADIFVLRQVIEGYNSADLLWGTSSAATVTLSFKVYSSLTGTFGGSLMNSAGDRSYPFIYTISAANTWTTISITIPGDTSGTWLTTNGIGIRVHFGLGVGTTFSGTAGAWAGAGYYSATGATSVVSTNGATFYITGVQLEKGSTATSFDYRPYGTELSLCQRYYAKLGAVSGGTGAFAAVGSGHRATTTIAQIYIKYPVAMRAAPTFDGSALTVATGGTNNSVTSPASVYPGTDSSMIEYTGLTSSTVGLAAVLYTSSISGYLAANSEL